VNVLALYFLGLSVSFLKYFQKQPMSARILLVEDDLTISAIVSGYLESEGMVVDVVGTGIELLRRLGSRPYDAVLLDLGLPDEDGLALLRKLASRSEVPVMVVTARNTLETRLTAFELGAADILTKPFDPRELRYRVLNLIRRGALRAVPAKMSFGQWRIDANSRTVESTSSDAICPLTRAEFDLLLFLLRGKGRVFSRSQILDSVSMDSGPDSDRAVDILISRLRRKLALDLDARSAITTVRGVGYRLEHRGPVTAGASSRLGG
jgi:DNA-binding response OmpR family regulator